MNRESDSPTIDWLHDVYEKKKRRAVYEAFKVRACGVVNPIRAIHRTE
ncbi:hypothetical protein [Paenibacillus nasutitermitis]|uniref:Uncharacterized protein n=1 Tax=Paenibacillus nasutitermitis TaxID=1652958 RepID=A0A916YUF5_9BACL|nr:hypothetical protein [Paenibacillus nasutitermitis]GGD61779.1 hypothetical protein GCM10010911_19610 [Paenibacillus nasutitermitis]